MIDSQPVKTDEDIDGHVDAEIAACLNLTSPHSFFLFAGAGSGKTRSLVTALKHIQKTFYESLKLKGQKVGVITFTNAASDEIKRRLLFDPLIDVRTIHSFAWSLIEGLNHDIREWLRIELTADVRELQTEEEKGRKGNKASAIRLRKIELKTLRLQNLNNISHFVYSPTGDNRGRDSLSHSEVLRLTSHFLSKKPTMQAILTGRYPILLIDESQDTNRHIVDALFEVQATHKSSFVLGLFGDMMQRIYNDGKDGLDQNLPEDWATPGKELNFRCPRRVVTLINKVRSAADGQQQKPRSNAVDGFVRLFIFPTGVTDKPMIEQAVARQMAQITGDEGWANPNEIKTLTLEHRMAASRMGFLDMFVPLYQVDSWRTSFLEGSLPVARFFTEDVLPLVNAKKGEDRFAIARIAKALSPLLTPEALRAAEDQAAQLQKVITAIDQLMTLWKDGADPSLLKILRCIAQSKLLEIPESLKANAFPDESFGRPDQATEAQEDHQSDRAEAIDKFLNAPFSQVEPFAAYLSGEAHFDTHQGVKGLEFDRVMVIMDDEEARGFLFKYEDLFGGRSSGQKTVESTRRLFYVTCSRAKRSLALVAYAGAPERVRDFVIQEGWFNDDEIITSI
ncbi:MAG: ATP-dependent helicase [Elusimicrobia bacterium]|nr:ATP-dependent helicase [Elusimicrobiota bacterium]